MSTLLHDLRHGWRTLRRSPGFTAAAVATLALGVGANGAIFSAVDALLFAPLPFPDAGRLVHLTESYPFNQRLPVALPNFLDWERASRSFEELAVYRGEEVTLGDGRGEPARLQGGVVSADLLPLLGAVPRLGRGFLPAEDRPGEARTALLGQALFHRRFGGDPAVVGTAVRLNGEPFTIVGVVPFDFTLPDLGTADLWLPLGVQAERLMNRGLHSNTRALGLLRPGVSLARARAEMAGIARRLAARYPDTNAQGGVDAAPLEERLRGSLRQPLLLLWGAVGFVLLVACANVANLLLARAETRQREVAIRSALGASSLRLARQLVTETSLLALLGGAAGLLLAAWGVDLLRALAEQSVPGRLAERIALDGRALGFTALLSLATGLLLGLAPVARVRAGELGMLGRVLQGRGGSEGTGRGRIQPLVTAEVALALLLAAGAGLMARSLWNLARVDPGFAPEGAATLELSLPAAGYEDMAKVQALFGRIEERAAALPGVEAAGLIEYLPLSGSNSWTSVSVAGWPPPAPGEGPLSLQYRTVSPGAFRALGIPLLRGRLFTAADRQGAPGGAADADLAGAPGAPGGRRGGGCGPRGEPGPATDLPTLAGAALLLAAVAGLASYLPARRAARVDPMTALRTE